MSKTSDKKSFFEVIATFIVDRRNLIFFLYLCGFVFSIFAQGWVSVCDDLTAYLPAETETRRGLTIMEDEFITYGTARIMVSNVTYADAEQLANQIRAVDGVTQVEFDESESHFKNAAALFDVTFEGEAMDDISIQAIHTIRERLSGYDFYISSEVGQSLSDTLAGEMNIILVIAAVIIVLVLLFTSRTYADIPVLLITFSAAAILNKGTNFLFGEISFVSDSVTVVLQLALAIDYAIIMLHRFTEERQLLEPREACIAALSKAIPEISASSLTTISGLMAMMFMQFGIGFDMGMVLIKAILFSMLSVFTLMPGLLMLFTHAIDKSAHRNFVPTIDRWGRFVLHTRFVFPPLFVVLIIAGFLLSNQCPYAYGTNTVSTPRQNENQIANEKINAAFGSQNIMALIVPTGSYDKEKALLADLATCEQVDFVTGLANVEAMDGHTLTDGLTPRQFAEMTDLDYELIQLLYTAYAIDHEDYGRIVNGLDHYTVPLMDMFLFVYDQKEAGYFTPDDALGEELEDLHTQLVDARAQLLSDTYSRMLISLKLPEEGQETFDFLQTIHEIAAKYYPADSFYLVGNSTSDYDLSVSFARDNVIISVLSIAFVIVVLLFTFQSAGLPVLLILVIQGSIWINFSYPTLTGTPIYFMSYLVVSSIQMGANIDYAIVISNRYLDLKTTMSREEAMVQSLNQAFPTVLTSGSILASAGILISRISTEPSIVGIGTCLGRGTILSMVLVMCVLPQLLLLGDAIIERTTFRIKLPERTQNVTGTVYVNGHVRGQITGLVDANVHGVIRGQINAMVDAGAVQTQKEESHETED